MDFFRLMFIKTLTRKHFIVLFLTAGLLLNVSFGQECEDIEYSYDQLHSGYYSGCIFNQDCIAVWGDCDVGLGGCHYAVNQERYLAEEVDELVDIWFENDCMQWVCDCAGLPNVQCQNGYCQLTYCYDPNPEGCFNSGCPNGYECMNDPGYCVPSSCACDEFYGQWFCTEDCGGGTCIEISYGDINNDGAVDILDVILAVNIVLNNEYDNLADMNNDGAVDILDVVIMVSIILGGLP